MCVEFVLFSWCFCALWCLCSLSTFVDFSLIVLKVREDQEKRKLEEEAQNQSTSQQPGQPSCVEIPLSQPVPQSASYVSPQLNQHSSQISAQPASLQNLQNSNYNAAQSTQLIGMSQEVSYVPQSAGQVPVQGQSVSGVQPEYEEPVTDQQLHTGGSKYLRDLLITSTLF